MASNGLCVLPRSLVMNLFNDQPPTGLLAVPKAMRNGFYLHEHMPHPSHMSVPRMSFAGPPNTVVHPLITQSQLYLVVEAGAVDSPIWTDGDHLRSVKAMGR